MIANARMYSVSPEVEAQWRALLARITASAGVALDYVAYPAPQPLETLWQRPDLGAVFMCGYPIGLKIADVQPIAAPIPAVPWAAGRAVYRSDFIVRADSAFQTLVETFGGRFGWTVSHSHSGFNAPRHHLLKYRTAARRKLFGAVTGDLVTARAILDRVIDGSIDVGPLDAYWHLLMQKYRPEITSLVRVVESTAIAPMPSFVAGAGIAPEVVARLQQAFVEASAQDWFSPFAESLCLTGFQAMGLADYRLPMQWQEEALAAGYALPE